MTQESKSRTCLVAGILLGCISIMVFLMTGGHIVVPFALMAVALSCSFWGLWSLHRYQVRSREP
jgi:hypothetical protein